MLSTWKAGYNCENVGYLLQTWLLQTACSDSTFLFPSSSSAAQALKSQFLITISIKFTCWAQYNEVSRSFSICYAKQIGFHVIWWAKNPWIWAKYTHRNEKDFWMNFPRIFAIDDVIISLEAHSFGYCIGSRPNFRLLKITIKKHYRNVIQMYRWSAQRNRGRCCKNIITIPMKS